MQAIAREKDVSPSSMFEVRWAPFQLNPLASPEGVNKLQYYNEKFGAARVKGMIPQMRATGLADGIDFSYGGSVANTLNSHRLAELARRSGGSKMQNLFIEAIFKRYFEQEKSPNDFEVLCAAATEAGLDLEAAKTLLGDELASPSAGELQKEIREVGKKYEVHGVPHFVIGKFSFSGAQDVPTMKKVLLKALAE